MMTANPNESSNDLKKLAELEALFKRRISADMRAIAMWRAAGGDELTFPDHADLVVWLLGRLEEKDDRIDGLLKANNALVEARREAERHAGLISVTNEAMAKSLVASRGRWDRMRGALRMARDEFLFRIDSHQDTGNADQERRNRMMVDICTEVMKEVP